MSKLESVQNSLYCTFKYLIAKSLMETNLHSLPDVLKVVLQDLLLLCHYCPSGMGSLAILQENKTYTCMKNNYADPFMT